jgi:hypothetical protein
MQNDEFHIDTGDKPDSVQIDLSRRGSRARTPQSREFQLLSIMMTGCGGLVTLVAIPLVLFSGSRLPGWIMLLIGVSYLVTGFGFSGYHRWAWYFSVLLVLPASLLISLAAVALMLRAVYQGRIVSIFAPLMALFVFYVGWVLLSKGGRARYYETVEAIQRARNDPDSLAGRSLAVGRRSTRIAWIALGALGVAVVVTVYGVNQLTSERPVQQQWEATDPPEAIAALRDLDAKLRLDPGGNVTNVLLNEHPGLTDEQLAPIARLTKVLQVNLANTGATDATLERLTNVRTLKYLDLEGTPITDAGLRHVVNLPLESLDLESTAVSSDGLRHVESLKRLRKLNLAGTDVDDEGLEHLRGLNQLQRLVVKDTQVTSDGVESLKESLPLCRIFH